MPRPPDVARDGGLLLPGDEFLGKYEILKVLGSGGHASVYLAKQKLIGRECALKVIRQDGEAKGDALHRATTEARILITELKHPHIVDVTHADIEQGVLYMVMEHLPGRTLLDALREHRQLGVLEALEFFATVAETIHFAHERGIVHRDLKPANLFITPGNAPKVLDFGVAKILGPSKWQTAPNTVVGTAKYLSPEQCLNLPVSPKTDIYALGEVLFECLVGQHWGWLSKPPTSYQELVELKTGDPPPRLDELLPRVPSYVADVVQRALLRRPEQRFPTALDLAEKLRRCIDVYTAHPAGRGLAFHRRELWHPVRLDVTATQPDAMVFSDGSVAPDAPHDTVEDSLSSPPRPSPRTPSPVTLTTDSEVVRGVAPSRPLVAPAPRGPRRFGRVLIGSLLRRESLPIVLSGIFFGLSLAFLLVVLTTPANESPAPARAASSAASPAQAATTPDEKTHPTRASLPGSPRASAPPPAAPASSSLPPEDPLHQEARAKERLERLIQAYEAELQQMTRSAAESKPAAAGGEP